MDAFPHIAFAARSDIGRKRKNNEDSLGAFPSLGVWCVADGMGGGDDGEVASAATIGAVEKFSKANPAPANAAFSAESVAAGVCSAVNGASKWIFERAKSRSLKGCGSTFVGVCLDPARPSEATALHAGDSRLYRIRGRGIQQITKDHSAAELVGAKNESELNPMFRGMILRAVGIQPSVQIDSTPFQIKEGDFVLICSDGLSRMVPDRKIASIARDKKTPDAVVDALIAAANDAGGIDNVTVVLLKVGKLPPPIPTVEAAMAPGGPNEPATAGGKTGLETGDADSETSVSFEPETDCGESDTASFATVTPTSATAAGTSATHGGEVVCKPDDHVGSVWRAMQEIPSDESPEKKRDAKRIAIAASAVAGVVAVAFFAMRGCEVPEKPGNSEKPPESQKATEAETKRHEAEERRIVEEQKADEERRKLEAEMAEMKRKLKEAEEKAAKEKAEREAEAKRLEAERKAAEEARLRAEAEAKRIEEERRRAEAARRDEEERRKAEEERRKADEERRRIEEQKRREEEKRRAAEAEARSKAEAAEAARLAALREEVRPMLEDAGYYLDDKDIREAMKCLKRACDAGYVLPKEEWFSRVNAAYSAQLQYLNKHMNNKNMAASRSLDPAALKAEFDELGELFAALRFSTSGNSAAEK